MRIGIYSGTFDPMHEGHVLFAQVTAEHFGLDKVLILPERHPRYKDSVADYGHRLAMCAIAIQDTEANMETFELTDLASHTVNGVIANIYEQYPEDEYYLIMGSDVLRTVPKWGERDDEDGGINEIAGSVGMVVGIDSMDELPELKKIVEKHGLNARFIETPAKKLSSRNIRSSVAAGESPRGLNDEVANYIAREDLYK